MDAATRNDLNAAGDKFLAHLLQDLRKPREYQPTFRDENIARDLEATRERVARLEDELVDGKFGADITFSASRIAAKAGFRFDKLDAVAQPYVVRMAAQAHLQQMEAHSLSLTDPGAEFQSRPLYDAGAIEDGLAARPQDQARTLGDMVETYIEFRQTMDVSRSTRDEERRALAWMMEALGPKSTLASITPHDTRKVRDGFQKMDVRKRGKPGPFLKRQTENKDHWIKPQTSSKYWRSVQAFFAWSVDEGYLEVDPASGIRVPRRANVVVNTPDPFTNAEVDAILKTPLFTGRKHKHAYLTPGPYMKRCSYWWAIVMGLHTGMRAGEMNQLETTDFDFASSPPVIHVRRTNDKGQVTKRTKNLASIRDIPISPVLIQLGLEAFVAQRAKFRGTKRLFVDVPLGEVSGKLNSGMTHFFSRYWRGTGLWSTGRSTHVFRHTVVANLRENGVAEEVISAIVGHTAKTQTGRYGKNTRPLSELADAIGKLDYGIDIPLVIEIREAIGSGA